MMDAMTPTQVRNRIYSEVSRAVSHGQTLEASVEAILAVVDASHVQRDVDEPRRPLGEDPEAIESLLELVADAMTFALGAWSEEAAITLSGGPAATEDPSGWARTFLGSYRALVVLWDLLPPAVVISDALAAARLDAGVFGTGFLRVDKYGRLVRLEPNDVILEGPVRRAHNTSVRELLDALQLLITTWLSVPERRTSGTDLALVDELQVLVHQHRARHSGRGAPA